ncbi:hypothetical protein M885DRAFT_591637 [Pelagophyceae sp. CCMP2097]|nr:hypothetical protein M885DRAFT_591637 [Pelagophyceae sp. CCMP2097]|mmetsp:Transcript_18827/g.63622  ORF Transcript_18827/g.63622 Transcript_18827/m.63622 type:complete len:136 (+) Transcript_18827:64-471(+)
MAAVVAKKQRYLVVEIRSAALESASSLVSFVRHKTAEALGGAGLGGLLAQVRYFDDVANVAVVRVGRAAAAAFVRESAARHGKAMHVAHVSGSMRTCRASTLKEVRRRYKALRIPADQQRELLQRHEAALRLICN